MALRRLTIVHVDTERGWRGGQRQVLLLAGNLARLGHRNVIAARPDSALAMRAAAEGLPVLELAPRFEMDPVAAWRLRRAAEVERADILHAHAAHASMLAALASLRSPARLVITRRVDVKPNANPFSRWKYRRAHGIIAISEAVAGALAAGGVPRERVTIATSGLDFSCTTAPAAASVLATFGVPPGAPLVVSAGALVAHKDPLGFTRAFAALRRRCPSAHALMVGDGPLRQDVEALRREMGLAETLHLAGFQENPTAFIAAADAFAVASTAEGLGTVILDAMSHGVPVAATRAGGIPELVDDDVTGLTVPVHDPEALGDALARLLLDRDLSRRLATTARERVHRFSIAHTVERTMDVYERTLAGCGRPALPHLLQPG